MFKEKLEKDLLFLLKKKEYFLNTVNLVKDEQEKENMQDMINLIDDGLLGIRSEIDAIINNYPINEHTWKHYTSDDNYISIIEKGFSLPKEYTRFGKGIYFTRNQAFSGAKEIKVKINTPILSLWHCEICTIFKEYNLQPEEEGIPRLEEYTKELGYLAVEVKYFDGYSELAVYDNSVIEVL